MAWCREWRLALEEAQAGVFTSQHGPWGNYFKAPGSFSVSCPDLILSLFLPGQELLPAWLP